MMISDTYDSEGPIDKLFGDPRPLLPYSGPSNAHVHGTMAVRNLTEDPTIGIHRWRSESSARKAIEDAAKFRMPPLLYVRYYPETCTWYTEKPVDLYGILSAAQPGTIGMLHGGLREPLVTFLTAVQANMSPQARVALDAILKEAGK